MVTRSLHEELLERGARTAPTPETAEERTKRLASPSRLAGLASLGALLLVLLKLGGLLDVIGGHTAIGTVILVAAGALAFLAMFRDDHEGASGLTEDAHELSGGSSREPTR